MLYICKIEKAYFLVAHPVTRDKSGKWIRIIDKEPFIKILNNGIVLKLEMARLISPYISSNWNNYITSEYHICLYGDRIAAISDEKWKKNFRKM